MLKNHPLDREKSLKTIDGGSNWIKQTSGTTCSLNAVHFVNENIGTAVGSEGYPFSGIILRTTDGGDNWIIQSSGVKFMLNEVCFTDSYNGVVVGGGTAFGGGYGTILRTTDGGENWMCQLVDTTIIRLRGVYCTDILTVTAVGDGTGYLAGIILRTTDGGENWRWGVFFLGSTEDKILNVRQ